MYIAKKAIIDKNEIDRKSSLPILIFYSGVWHHEKKKQFDRMTMPNNLIEHHIDSYGGYQVMHP